MGSAATWVAGRAASEGAGWAPVTEKPERAAEGRGATCGPRGKETLMSSGRRCTRARGASRARSRRFSISSARIRIRHRPARAARAASRRRSSAASRSARRRAARARRRAASAASARPSAARSRARNARIRLRPGSPGTLVEGPRARNVGSGPRGPRWASASAVGPTAPAKIRADAMMVRRMANLLSPVRPPKRARHSGVRSVIACTSATVSAPCRIRGRLECGLGSDAGRIC